MDSPVLIYLAAVNVLTFFAYGGDKLRAKMDGVRRTPEKTLLGLAVIGGSLGALLGMHVFRHKTRHWYFRYGIPAILLVQLVLAAWLYLG